MPLKASTVPVVDETTVGTGESLLLQKKKSEISLHCSCEHHNINMYENYIFKLPQ